MSINSYPKIYNMGHPAIARLFDDDVTVQEKVDGSQFSFAKVGGEVVCRSKNQVFLPSAAHKMFQQGCEYVVSIADRLPEGWLYRCEYLQKPKHNALAYDRVPTNHLMLFDIHIGLETYAGRDVMSSEAERLNIELVPEFFVGQVKSVAQLQQLLETQSALGGQKIEGVVCKSRTLFGRDGKALMGKHVSEEFREIAHRDWKDRHPSQGDLITQFIEEYRTPARWNKAYQHLRDDGLITDSPQDIGALMKECHQDTWEECKDEIAAKFLKHIKAKFLRGVARGLPEWYKEKLMESQFDNSMGHIDNGADI